MTVMMAAPWYVWVTSDWLVDRRLCSGFHISTIFDRFFMVFLGVLDFGLLVSFDSGSSFDALSWRGSGTERPPFAVSVKTSDRLDQAFIFVIVDGARKPQLSPTAQDCGFCRIRCIYTGFGMLVTLGKPKFHRITAQEIPVYVSTIAETVVHDVQRLLDFCYSLHD